MAGYGLGYDTAATRERPGQVVIDLRLSPLMRCVRWWVATERALLAVLLRREGRSRIRSRISRTRDSGFRRRPPGQSFRDLAGCLPPKIFPRVQATRDTGVRNHHIGALS